MKKYLLSALFLIVFFLFPQCSQAQSVQYKKLMKLDFTKGDLFSGSLSKPDGAHLEVRRLSLSKKFFV